MSIILNEFLVLYLVEFEYKRAFDFLPFTYINLIILLLSIFYFYNNKHLFGIYTIEIYGE